MAMIKADVIATAQLLAVQRINESLTSQGYEELSDENAVGVEAIAGGVAEALYEQLIQNAEVVDGKIT